MQAWWLVAVGMIDAWPGMSGPAFALVRLVALAITGYACVGLACWAVVFEVVAAGITGQVYGQRASSTRR